MEIDHVQMVLPEPVSSEGLLLWTHKINGTVRLGNALKLNQNYFYQLKSIFDFWKQEILKCLRQEMIQCAFEAKDKA